MMDICYDMQMHMHMHVQMQHHSHRHESGVGSGHEVRDGADLALSAPVETLAKAAVRNPISCDGIHHLRMKFDKTQDTCDHGG